jgi:hypothetical protein
LKILKANILVFLAYLTNNKYGKQVDVHGRTYRYVYKKFCHKAMVNEYLDENSWDVK